MNTNIARNRNYMRTQTISHFKKVHPNIRMDDGNDNDIETQENMEMRENKNRDSTLRRTKRNVCM